MAWFQFEVWHDQINNSQQYPLGIEPLPRTVIFNPCIFATQFRKIFQTINSVWSNNLSLKYQRLPPSDYTDLEITTFDKDSVPFSIEFHNGEKDKLKYFFNVVWYLKNIGL